MTERTTNLQAWDQYYPDIGNVGKIKGGSLATQSSRNAALRSQMQILPHGRRVVGQVGLHGQMGFFVQDGIDPETESREYPEATWDRTLYRGKINVTPGYELWVALLAVPSGPCQHYAGGGSGYETGSDSAKLTISINYDSGVVDYDLVKIMQPPWSVLSYKALDSAVGGAFDLTLLQGRLGMPQAVWTEHVVATVSAVALGGLRPVEIIFYEQPKELVRHDDSHRECTIPMVWKGKQLPALPITGLTYNTNATLGSHQVSKSLRDYRRATGPYLVSWSAWDETGTALADDAEGVMTITNTSYEDLQYTMTSFAVTNPGWSMSSGGTARNLEQNGPLEMRGVNGCVPVLIRAYCKVSSGTGSLKFQTANYSLRELSTTSTSYGWVEGLAWLRCGPHQTVSSVLEVFGKCSGGGTLSIRYLSVEHWGNYNVTE